MTKSFEFHSRVPDGALADAVETMWFARGTVAYRQEHIAPTGSCVAIFVLGDPIEQTPLGKGARSVRSRIGLFVGPHTGPMINRPLGETYAVGIVAKATGAERLFNLRPATKRGLVCELGTAWSDAPMFLGGLRSIDDGDPKLGWLERELTKTLSPASRTEIACRRAISILESDPKTLITELATEIGMSVSNLDRVFTRIVGLTPRAHANLLRMRTLLKALDVGQEINWADTAAEFGWYDQPHFIKAFKQHTGHTPTAYVAAQRRHFDDSTLANAAGFVPQG